MWSAPTDIRISILKGFTDNSISSNQFTTVRNFLGHAFACPSYIVRAFQKSNPEVFPWNIPRVFQKWSRGILLEYSRSVPVEYSWNIQKSVLGIFWEYSETSHGAFH